MGIRTIPLMAPRPSGVASGGGGAGGPWPPGASLGGGAGPACRGEF